MPLAAFVGGQFVVKHHVLIDGWRWLLVIGSLGAVIVLATPQGMSNVFSNSFQVYQAEIFPTRIRATAVGAAYSLSRLSGAILPFIADGMTRMRHRQRNFRSARLL